MMRPFGRAEAARQISGACRYESGRGYWLLATLSPPPEAWRRYMLSRPRDSHRVILSRAGGGSVT